VISSVTSASNESHSFAAFAEVGRATVPYPRFQSIRDFFITLSRIKIINHVLSVPNLTPKCHWVQMRSTSLTTLSWGARPSGPVSTLTE
jgi:hypothetical protein